MCGLFASLGHSDRSTEGLPIDAGSQGHGEDRLGMARCWTPEECEDPVLREHPIRRDLKKIVDPSLLHADVFNSIGAWCISGVQPVLSRLPPKSMSLA